MIVGGRLNRNALKFGGNPRRAAWFLGALIALGSGIAGGSVLWHAHSALQETRDRIAWEGDLRTTVRPVALAIPVGLEPIGAPAVFHDAQIFHGRLFLAGPAGLTAFDSNGAVAERYRVGLELPAAPVTSLAVGLAGDSHEPELWIGTAGQGLVAFDGRAFRQILPEDPSFAKITSLLPVSTGRILLGTEKRGVLVYDGSHLRPFHASLADVSVTVLAGDDADLWAGTLDRGLIHWRAGAAETIGDALPDKRVLSLAISGDAVYAGTALGIAELRDGRFTRTLAPGYFAQTVYADAGKLAGGNLASGKLWMGTLEEGMLEVPLDSGAVRGLALRASDACPGCSIRKIFRVDRDLYTLAQDSLWRGSEAVLRPEDAPLRDRNIAALSTDKAGRLWIGYFDRGLQILTPGSPGRGIEWEDDHLFCVNRIVHDSSRGVSAVATANGLVMFDASTARRRVIGQADGLIANQVTDVAFRADGSLVAATPAGVSFVDAAGISSVYAFQGLVNNHVYALGVDGSRTLAGTLGGLSVLDAGLVKASYTTANSALKHNWITAMVPAGRDWYVGTYGAGVMRLTERGQWESFPDLRGNVEINANAMTVSPRAVYAGTLDRGLAVYSFASGRWNYFTAGLPSHNVTAVEASGGVLYIGTDNGLVRVPESSVVTP